MIISLFNKLALTRFSYVNAVFFCLLSASVNALEWSGHDLRGAPCTGKPQGFGPYDYTNPYHKAEKLPIVEGRHFTPEMEANAGIKLKRPGDYDYTLRAFPNHHRALYAVVRHQLSFDQELHQQGGTPAECYFQKAIAFVPRDIKVYQLYAYYLGKMGKNGMAIDQYLKALAIKPDPRIHYQVAKLYFKAKQFEKAAEHAVLAIERGYKRQDLKKKLQSIGKWPAQP